MEINHPASLGYTRDYRNPHDLSGWWYTYPSEKYDFVSWDDDVPN